jgi:hypothetical protein
VYVKNGATTRRYLGSFRTTSTTTTEDSAARRLLWNMQHRVPRPLSAADATSSWSYSTASWRQANGSSANQVDLLVGLEVSFLHLQVSTVRSNASATLGASSIGIGSTSSPGTGVQMSASTNVAGGYGSSSARFDGSPALGYSFYAWLESGSGSGTDTWYGTSGNILSGMSGMLH